MKILFINKYDTSGGAAIAAMRLSDALIKKYHTQNYFLTAVKNSSSQIVTAARKPGWQSAMERGINIITNQLGLQYFYFPFSTKNIFRFAKKYQPDIISLHNVHGGYFDLSLLPKLSAIAPVVWTLHDMWAFTGNAAHTFGDESWKHLRAGKKENIHFPKIGLPTGKWLLQRKKKIYAKSNLTIITPSQWLHDLAVQSPVFINRKITAIPNGIPLNKFIPADKMKIKKELGLHEDELVITFSAEKLMRSEHKGGQELLSVLKLIDEKINQPLQVVMIGKDRLPASFKHLHCIYTGYLSTEKEMINYLQATDIFFYPTKADTLPNSLIEAIACGVPCITFDAGGCKEIIEDETNGFVIAAGDIKAFANRALQLMQDAGLRNEFSEQARELAVRKFGEEKMASAYYEIFQKLTNA